VLFFVQNEYEHGNHHVISYVRYNAEEHCNNVIFEGIVMDPFFIYVIVFIVFCNCAKAFLKASARKKSGQDDDDPFLDDLFQRKKNRLRDDIFAGDERGPLGIFHSND